MPSVDQLLGVPTIEAPSDVVGKAAEVVAGFWENLLPTGGRAVGRGVYVGGSTATGATKVGRQNAGMGICRDDSCYHSSGHKRLMRGILELVPSVEGQ